MICKNFKINISLCLLIFAYACQNGQSSDNNVKKKSVLKSSDKQTTVPESVVIKKDTLGPEITEFLEDYNYIIQYEAVGLLNQDDFKDKVLILQEGEEDKSLGRVTLILLGKKEGFELYKKSYTIMPPEYNTDNYKTFDVEDVSIEKNKIVIDLSSIGPNGHISFEFLFKNNDLQLHEFTGYFMGAGSHTEYIYKPKNQNTGTLEETTIHTMEDDMPSTAKSYDIKLKSPVGFDNFDYSKFLNEIIQQAD